MMRYFIVHLALASLANAALNVDLDSAGKFAHHSSEIHIPHRLA